MEESVGTLQAGGRASAKMAVFCNKKIMPVEEAEIAQR
jgi:hypothetical protein